MERRWPRVGRSPSRSLERKVFKQKAGRERSGCGMGKEGKPARETKAEAKAFWSEEGLDRALASASMRSR